MYINPYTFLGHLKVSLIRQENSTVRRTMSITDGDEVPTERSSETLTMYASIFEDTIPSEDIYLIIEENTLTCSINLKNIDDISTISFQYTEQHDEYLEIHSLFRIDHSELMRDDNNVVIFPVDNEIVELFANLNMYVTITMKTKSSTTLSEFSKPLKYVNML